MSRKQKFLVCGDVGGNFKTLFSRVNAINEKNGPFDFLFCVGDFFSDSLKKLEPYKNGSLSVTVPTYILGPNKENHLSFYDNMSGCEICPNVYFLGKYGILTSNGLKIAYISGIESNDMNSDIVFTETHAKAIKNAALKNKEGSKYLGVDLLLSSEWPMDVEKIDKSTKFQDVEIKGSKILAELACLLKPRYHFSGLKHIYYERSPYRNCIISNDVRLNSSHTTRFIGLAKVGNINKNKWLYAANLTPLADLEEKDLLQSTTNETECPYAHLTKKSVENFVQYFYDMNTESDTLPKKRKRKNSSSEKTEKIKKKNFDDPENCWFCLASSSVEKHLVISLKEEVYLALAKGGLTPLHAMIVPIKHHRSQIELPKVVMEEVKKYKSLLRKFFESKNLAPVIFERNYKTSHLQLHVIPVPLTVKTNLKKSFLNYSEDVGLKLTEMPNKTKLKDYFQPGTPYFYLELPGKERFISSCQKNFPIHFGRDVLTTKEILNKPDKVNWRDCIESKEQEEKMVRTFREQFKNFDELP